MICWAVGLYQRTQHLVASKQLRPGRGVDGGQVVCSRAAAITDDAFVEKDRRQTCRFAQSVQARCDDVALGQGLLSILDFDVGLQPEAQGNEGARHALEVHEKVGRVAPDATSICKGDGRWLALDPQETGKPGKKGNAIPLERALSRTEPSRDLAARDANPSRGRRGTVGCVVLS